MQLACGGQRVQSVVDDDGASHPQAGVRVRRGEDEPLWWALRDPAQGDLLAGLPASVPQLGAGQQPSGPPGKGGDKTGHKCRRKYTDAKPILVFKKNNSELLLIKRSVWTLKTVVSTIISWVYPITVYKVKNELLSQQFEI